MKKAELKNLIKECLIEESKLVEESSFQDLHDTILDNLHILGKRADDERLDASMLKAIKEFAELTTVKDIPGEIDFDMDMKNTDDLISQLKQYKELDEYWLDDSEGYEIPMQLMMDMTGKTVDDFKVVKNKLSKLLEAPGAKRTGRFNKVGSLWPYNSGKAVSISPSWSN
jgi:hypothetical protein